MTYKVKYSVPTNYKKPEWAIEAEKRAEESKRRSLIYEKVCKLAKTYDSSLGKRKRGVIAGRCRKMLADAFDRKFEKKRGK